MNKVDTIELRLGERDGEAFVKFLQEKRDTLKEPANVDTTFKPERPPVTGAGFPLPPEAVIVVSSAAGMIAGGVLTGFGRGIGGWLWEQLKTFFSGHAPSDKPQYVGVRINGSDPIPVPLTMSAENSFLNISIHLADSTEVAREAPPKS